MVRVDELVWSVPQRRSHMSSTSDDRQPDSSAPRQRITQFGDLEAAVMSVLWEHEGWMTPGEVRDALPQGARLAYTTVMTVMARLWKKGILERQRDGRAYAYHPVESREEWTGRRMEELLAAAGNASEALAHFVRGLDRDEQNQLRRILRAGPSR